MALTVDVCLKCGKSVIKSNPVASSDMVVIDLEALYLCDAENEEPRPGLELNGEMCPGCLLETVSDWVEKISKVKPSNIPSIDIGKVPTKQRASKYRSGDAKITPHQSTIEEQLNAAKKS